MVVKWWLCCEVLSVGRDEEIQALSLASMLSEGSPCLLAVASLARGGEAVDLLISCHRCEQ